MISKKKNLHHFLFFILLCVLVFFSSSVPRAKWYSIVQNCLPEVFVLFIGKWGQDHIFISLVIAKFCHKLCFPSHAFANHCTATGFPISDLTLALHRAELLTAEETLLVR